LSAHRKKCPQRRISDENTRIAKTWIHDKQHSGRTRLLSNFAAIALREFDERPATIKGQDVDNEEERRAIRR
jgi:hypothetical protein